MIITEIAHKIKISAFIDMRTYKDMSRCRVWCSFDVLARDLDTGRFSFTTWATRVSIFFTCFTTRFKTRDSISFNTFDYPLFKKLFASILNQTNFICYDRH